MIRFDGRSWDQLRNIKITRNFTSYAEGSVLIEFGNTKVICTASIEEKVPPFMKGSGNGWLTAEYSMLPRSCESRIQRDISKGQINGRSQEIQRLIGRSIRSAVNLDSLGERTVWLDCDVIQADGGTRTAAITGAFIAFSDACKFLESNNLLKKSPYTEIVAAVSVGIVSNEEILDLCYAEDSNAQVDMNVVMTSNGKIIEIQSTAEGYPFQRKRFDKLLDLASNGINQICQIVKKEIS